jgi:riboflavin kinase / FMN adenylyltransferase
MRLHLGVPADPTVPIALTIGNFDGVHCGHRTMLARLREAGKSMNLPVGVMSFEPHPREFFKPEDAPARLTSLREKVELLSEQGLDHLFICRFNAHFAAQSPEDFIDGLLVRKLNIRWLLVGDDFRFGAKRAGDLALLQEKGNQHGFYVESQSTVIDGEDRISSSLIREQLAQGKMEDAARLLGQPWHISGRVTQGDQVGRQWGFPTANIPLPDRRVPVTGIFAAKLITQDGMIRQGVASLGTRPAVKQQGMQLLEIHLFDFFGDLYGKRVRVELLYKFRDETSFKNVDALRAQIALDASHARQYFAQREQLV